MDWSSGLIAPSGYLPVLWKLPASFLPQSGNILVLILEIMCF